MQRMWGDEHRRSATHGLLGSPSRLKGAFGILQLLLGGGGRLFGLRLLQTVGLLLFALLPRVSLRRLPEVGGGVDPPSSGRRLCRPHDGGDDDSLKGKGGPEEEWEEYKRRLGQDSPKENKKA